MPRYFFHVHDGKDMRDEEGLDMPGDEEARTEAVRTAGEMLRDLADGFWDGESWTMEVVDMAGNRVCELKVLGSR